MVLKSEECKELNNVSRIIILMLTSKNNDSSGLSINEYPSNLKQYKARAKTITLQYGLKKHDDLSYFL